jgi:predicted nuclease of predicted toxin-antitoxin system
MLRLLLDAHVERALALGLRQRERELVVWRLGDPGAPARDASDPAILAWCEAHDFVLVTNNRRTMPRHLADHLGRGGHVPGIFMLNVKMSLAETIENLLDATLLSLEGEYRDQIRHLPL